jgi:chorismate mutase / prephenate dehydratase
MSDSDPIVVELRAEISALDRQLLAAVNRRLELVRRLHEHKLATGMPLRDLVREVAMLRALEAENSGPLSADGVACFFTDVVELIRQEMYGDD